MRAVRQRKHIGLVVVEDTAWAMGTRHHNGRAVPLARSVVFPPTRSRYSCRSGSVTARKYLRLSHEVIEAPAGNEIATPIYEERMLPPRAHRAEWR